MNCALLVNLDMRIDANAAITLLEKRPGKIFIYYFEKLLTRYGPNVFTVWLSSNCLTLCSVLH